MYSALDVAKYAVAYSNQQGYRMSNLKLQKILYFIQAQYLVGEGTACFDDEIEAWDFGPVVPTVYQYYRGYGSVSIIESGESSRNQCRILPYDQNIINQIVEYFRDRTAVDLVNLTHTQEPWIKSYRRYCNNIISKMSIYNYFNQ